MARLGWRALAAAGRVVGPRVARGAAAVVLRARAGSADGWLEDVHRVASRPAPRAPALTRLPEGWWTASPRVRVRRLGGGTVVELTVVEAALGAAPGTAELRADPACEPADAGVRSLHGRGGRVQAVTVGVDGDEIHLLLSRLGYVSTGQVLPVANRVYRPAPGPSGNRVPGVVHRRSGAGGGCGAARIVRL